MANCFKFNISGNHNSANFRNLKYYLMIMFIMTIYYLVINIKHIAIIKSIYPPFFDFIDEFNGCIENEKEQKSMSVWYLLYLLLYIVIYSLIIIFIYVNIYGLFNTLGDAVFVFVIMMVFLYIIINRIIFYDQCFDPTDSESSCFTPKCDIDSEKPYYDFSSGKCVTESKSEDPKPEPEPEPDPDPSPSTPPSEEGRQGRQGGGIPGPPGAPGPPGPPGKNIIEKQTITQFLGDRIKNSYSNNSSNTDTLTEGFAIIGDISNKPNNYHNSNLKDVGNKSYMMSNLQKKLMNNIMGLI